MVFFKENQIKYIISNITISDSRENFKIVAFYKNTYASL